MRENNKQKVATRLDDSDRRKSQMLLNSASFDDSTMAGSAIEDLGEWETSLTPSRLLQLREATVFYIKALHTVHASKRGVVEHMQEKGCDLTAAVQHLVKSQHAEHRHTATDLGAGVLEGMLGGGAPAPPAPANGAGSPSTPVRSTLNHDPSHLEPQALTPSLASLAHTQEAKKKFTLPPGSPVAPSVPQLYPDVVPGSKTVWLEPLELLLGIAEVLFHGIAGFEDSDDAMVEEWKEIMFDKIRERAIADPAGSGVMMGEVDDLLWDCLQVWSGIVKRRMLSIRRMTSWFGDKLGGVKLCKSLHTMDSWKKLLVEKLNCRGRIFSGTLEKRDQLDIFYESYRRTLVDTERSFPLRTPQSTLDFTRLVAAFEEAVLPTVTIDLGGAENIATPVSIHSDEMHHRRKKLFEMRQREKAKRAGEVQQKSSFADRARAKQQKKLGKEEKEEDEEEDMGFHEYFESTDRTLVEDAWSTYGEVVERWTKAVDNSMIELSGNFDGESERYGTLKKDVEKLNSRMEELRAGDSNVEEAGGKQQWARSLTPAQHREARGKVAECWSLLAGIMNAVHTLSSTTGFGENSNITMEFLKDDWVKGGARYDMRGRTKVEAWI
jgi:hypothetical protein